MSSVVIKIILSYYSSNDDDDDDDAEEVHLHPTSETTNNNNTRYIKVHVQELDVLGLEFQSGIPRHVGLKTYSICVGKIDPDVYGSRLGYCLWCLPHRDE